MEEVRWFDTADTSSRCKAVTYDPETGTVRISSRQHPSDMWPPAMVARTGVSEHAARAIAYLNTCTFKEVS